MKIILDKNNDYTGYELNEPVLCAPAQLLVDIFRINSQFSEA